MLTVCDPQSKLLSLKNYNCISDAIHVVLFNCSGAIDLCGVTIGSLLLLPYTTTFIWTDICGLKIWLKNYKNDVIPVQINICFAIVLTHELTRSYQNNKVISVNIDN